MDVNEYLNLIPSENSRKERFMSYLKAVLSGMIELGVVTESFLNSFDLFNAAGNQLDIIGELIGMSRILKFVPANGDKEMDDDEYRLCILLKISQNEWDGTNNGAVEIYRRHFNDDIIVVYKDNQNLSVSFQVYGAFTVREAEILEYTGLLLVPAGVSTTVETSESSANIIGYTGCAVYSEWYVAHAHIVP